MSDADLEVELVVTFEFFESEQQGSRIRAA